MKPISLLIVDDEPGARKGIAKIAGKHGAFEILGEYGTPRSAIEAIDATRPDLVLLDVEMPGGTGFDVLKAIEQSAEPPAVIFVTAYDEHAVRAFEVNALDYVLKPFDGERLLQALNRAVAHFHMLDSERIRLRVSQALGSEDRPPVPQAVRREQRPDRIMVRDDRRVVFVRIEDIDWIEAADYYARIHVGRSSYLLRESLNSFEKTLDPNHFLRIHRSAIINLERVVELRPSSHGNFEVILRDGTELRLTRARRENLEDALGRTL